MEIWSFFSGAMGLDLGLEKAGLHPTLAVELDHQCCETIRLNRPKMHVLEQSVADMTARSLRAERQFDGDVFLMVGGPPCQSFSSGGNRAGLTDPRGNLIYEYMRLISDVKPQYFVFENVANIVTAALRHRPISERPGKSWNLSAYQHTNGPSERGVAPLEPDEMAGSAIQQILGDYSKIGYQLSFAVVDAADYGAAQHRLRFVMTGSRNDVARLDVPKATHGEGRTHPFRTVRDAIADLEHQPGPHSKYTPEVAKYFNRVPEGKNWRSLPVDLQREAMGPSFEAGGGKTGFFRRLGWDRPAPTITGKANRKATALCHPSQTRPLSVHECARLQGFADDWKIMGSMAAQYSQVGNAVPVELGHAIGLTLATAKKARKRPLLDQWTTSVQLSEAQARLRASARNKVVSKSATHTQSLFEPA